jgi:alpha-amylase/alpha-mannosidase (GH57 family)
LSRRISLALTLHNHQPMGNFGWVIAENFERAYQPMLESIERHPSVHLALHYTGPLLAWLRSERPEFLERLAGLVDRGQVEIVGGGWYEPVLAALPERDRIGQLVRMADELESLFGRRPRVRVGRVPVRAVQHPAAHADSGARAELSIARPKLRLHRNSEPMRTKESAD